MKKLFLLVLLAAFFLGFHSMSPQVISADQEVIDTSDGDDDVVPIPDQPDPPEDPEEDSDDDLIPEIDPEEDHDVVPEDDQDDPDDLLPIE